jgi:hypothetical protein
MFIRAPESADMWRKKQKPTVIDALDGKGSIVSKIRSGKLENVK